MSLEQCLKQLDYLIKEVEFPYYAPELQEAARKKLIEYAMKNGLLGSMIDYYKQRMWEDTNNVREWRNDWLNGRKKPY